jgi:hypothetical protein
VDLIQLRQAIVALVNSSHVRITRLLRRPRSMSLEQLTALQQWVDELNIEIARNIHDGYPKQYLKQTSD